MTNELQLHVESPAKKHKKQSKHN